MDCEKDFNIVKREALYDVGPFISYITLTYLDSLNIHKWNPCWRLYKYLYYTVLVQNSLQQRDVLLPVIVNIALETLLGTARIVEAFRLKLNWDIAELSRLSRYFLYSSIGTHRKCRDC